jgi:hypothetical protein
MLSNNRDPPSWSGIDRFLASLDWEAQFHEVSHKSLQSLCSDHFHILLDCGDFHKGKRYFKFESIWLKEKGFVGKVKQWWTSNCFQGSPSFIMASMLKALKANLIGDRLVLHVQEEWRICRLPFTPL